MRALRARTVNRNAMHKIMCTAFMVQNFFQTAKLITINYFVYILKEHDLWEQRSTSSILRIEKEIQTLLIELWGSTHKVLLCCY